jgi:hypothetical protein
MDHSLTLDCLKHSLWGIGIVVPQKPPARVTLRNPSVEIRFQVFDRSFLEVDHSFILKDVFVHL